MAYSRRTFTKELAEKLLAQHGTKMAAAKAIVSQCLDPGGNPASVHAVRQWIGEAISGILILPKQVFDADKADKINQIANLLEEANIPIESIGLSETLMAVLSSSDDWNALDSGRSPLAADFTGPHSVAAILGNDGSGGLAVRDVLELTLGHNSVTDISTRGFLVASFSRANSARVIQRSLAYTIPSIESRINFATPSTSWRVL